MGSEGTPIYSHDPSPPRKRDYIILIAIILIGGILLALVIESGLDFREQRMETSYRCSIRIEDATILFLDTGEKIEVPEEGVLILPSE